MSPPPPADIGNVGLRAIALRVGEDVTNAVNRAVNAGDVTWVEQLVLLLDTAATRDAHDAARAMARARRDTEPPPPPPDDPAAA